MTQIAENKKLLFKWAITIGLTVLPFLVPVNDIYTAQAQRFVAVTILGIAILGFELLPNFAVGVLLPTGWVLSGACNYQTAFSSWASTNLMMMIGAFLMANVLQEIGLLQRIGYWCVLKFGGTVPGVIWGLFIAGTILSAMTFTVVIILTIALAYAIYKAMELKPTDKESMLIVLVTIICTTQAKAFLYCPIAMSLLQGGTRTVFPDFVLPWYQVMAHNGITFIFCVALIWGFLQWYKRSSAKSAAAGMDNLKEHFTTLYNDLGPISKDEKKGIAILSVIVVYMVTQPFHNLDMTYAFMVASVVWYLPGIKLGTSQAVKDIPFDIIFLCAGFLGVAAVGASVGFNKILAIGLTPIMSSLGTYWSVLGTFIFATLANFILTPFAMSAMLPMPIAQFCADIGTNVLPHIYAMYMAQDMVFFPYEFPTYLIIFAFGMLGMKDMIKICFIKSILFFFFFVLVLMPVYNLVGIIF